MNMVKVFADRSTISHEKMPIEVSLLPEQRIEILRGIILTRAVDNHLKKLFLSGEIKYKNLGFQGKGFRSLGQEAIFAAGCALKRYNEARDHEGYQGDVVGPLIRDLGVALAFTDDVQLAINAQMAKDAPPLYGKDLHYGDYRKGVFPAAAPLTIATTALVGTAFAFKLNQSKRVAVSFIGEGGSSLGEWHEAINLASAHQLPMIFCLQNNQTALSTPVDQQSRVEAFRDKAAGYGIPGITIDGTDPEAIYAAFSWAADRARQGLGPTLIETESMRMCGHAHHDDMLYLGGEPDISFDIPPTPTSGYVDQKRYEYWRAKDPLKTYADKLLAIGLISIADLNNFKDTAISRCQAAIENIKSLSWPDATQAAGPVFIDQYADQRNLAVAQIEVGTTPNTMWSEPTFDRTGQTYLDAIALGLHDILSHHENAFIIGEDCAAPYGNAFLLLKPLLNDFSDRIYNAPIAEGAIIGTCIGAALEGRLPIGEMQFNDFVASGFNQLVNSAAKLHYRTGLKAPFIMRMPWGGLRRAGPYHSQDTSPWFYRTPGLKIVAPSTPHDARMMLRAAALDGNPVLFYEHIGLYRMPKIKQVLEQSTVAPSTNDDMSTAAFRKEGDDCVLISYGAYVHRALEAATHLKKEGYNIAVLDLRSLSPLDWPTIDKAVRQTGKVLLVGEDSQRGSILESIAANITERHFMHLDAPPKVLGALNTPVPYSPSLEDAFLLSVDDIITATRNMVNW